MRGINKVILIGNLGGDPELRYTANGNAVASFSLATTDVIKDRNVQQERTEWHRIVAWGRLAEICAEFLTKGQTVYIEGRLKNRAWQDKDGNKRYITEIVAQNMQMLSRNSTEEQGSLGAGEEWGSDNGPEGVYDDVPF